MKLVSDDFDEDAFSAAAVEFGVIDLFPWAEVELAVGDGDDDFAAHDLALEVSVGVVFAGAVVLVLTGGGMGRELFEPCVVVFDEAGLGVVDVDAGCDVHGVDEAKAVLHAGVFYEMFDLRCDVDVIAAIGGVEPEFLAQVFHATDVLDAIGG